MSCVFQNIDPPTPLSTRRGGRTHSPGGEGGGGQYFGRRKTQLGTLPISNPLWMDIIPLPENIFQFLLQVRRAEGCRTGASPFFLYTVKKVYRFSRPQPGMSLTKLSLAGKNLIIPARTEFGSDIPA
jgi:hypothetical protein